MNMMLKRNYIILNCVFFTVFFMSFLFSSCKTKEAKKEVIPFILPQRTYVIQVCDKFQLSYDGLPSLIYLSDGTTLEDKTAIDGKIIVKIFEGIKIEKIVYNFSNYKHKSGQLLASLDFEVAKKIPSRPFEKSITIMGPFSSDIKNLFILENMGE